LNSSSRILKHTFVFGIANGISKAINLILLPLYTNFMTISQFGVFSLGLTLYYIANMMFRAGATSVMFKEYFEKKDVLYRKILIGNTYIYLILIAIALFFLSVLFKDFLNTSIIHAENSFVIILILLTAISEALLSIPLSVLRAEEKSRLFGIFMVTQTLLTFILTYIALVVLEMNVVGAFAAMLIAKMVCFIAGTITIISRIKLKMDLSIIKELAFLGWPLVFSGLATWIITMSDKIIISIFQGPARTGLYSLPERIGSIMTIAIFTPFSLLWGFESLKIYYNEDWQKKFPRYFVYLAGASLAFASFLSLFAPELIVILGKAAYLDAVIVVPPILLALIFNIFTRFHTFYLTVRRKNYIATLITLTGAVVNVLLNIILVKYFDYRAVAFSTLFAFCIIYYMTYIYVNKTMKFNHNVKKVSLLIFVFLINAVIGNFVKEITLVNEFIKAALVIISIVIIVKVSELYFIVKQVKTFLHNLVQKGE